MSIEKLKLFSYIFVIFLLNYFWSSIKIKRKIETMIYETNMYDYNKNYLNRNYD